MRKRYLKPSLFENETLGDDTADPLYTILFAGLWCLADRSGRLKDRPQFIKSKIFPYRTVNDIDARLQWLADHGLVIRYEVDGARYIQVVTFSVHQSPHPNEPASVIPVFTADAATVTNGNRAVTNVNSTSLFNSNSNSNSVRGAAVAASDTAPVTDTAQTADDPVELRIWRDGVELLRRSGLEEKAARPLLGRWARDHGRVALAQAIAASMAVNSPDPKSYIGGILKAMRKDRAAMYVGSGGDVGVVEGVRDADACVECLGSRRVIRAAHDGEQGVDGLVLDDCPACVSAAIPDGRRVLPGPSRIADIARPHLTAGYENFS